MERLYAAQLRSRGVNGSVDLELGIDEAGRVISASVAASSGYDILDAAALKLTEAMRFSPAEASGKPVPASVRVPITFSESNSPSASDAPAPRSTGVLPKLLNPEEVQQALWSAYPNQLKRTGTGGTVRLRIDVDEAGKIVGTSISKGSGHAALDTAALQVVQMMRFAPAREQGARVNAAVEVPVTFQRRPRS
jgi:TonB family protein